MLTPYLKTVFDDLKAQYDQDSLRRVERMLGAVQPRRHPLQQGAKFIMPGITSKPWRDVSDYTEIAQLVTELEKSHAQIKTEINNVPTTAPALGKYQHYQVSLSNWKALYLYKDGSAVTENFPLVPHTAEFLQQHLQDLLCPLGEMHFSVLQGGASIPPHSDLWNFTLNLHLAVDIPNSCGIRVGNEARKWQEGKCLLFDYSYEHEAWNNSEQDRICLLMDLWNPEVTLPERAALTAAITEIRNLLKN